MSMVKTVAIAGVVILLSSMVLTSAQTDDVISTSYTPSSPTAGSTVTFYATVNGENVSGVTLWVEECTKTICHLPDEVVMSPTGEGNYTATYKLRDDTTYFHYKVFAEVDGETVESDVYNVTVASSQTDGSSSNDNTGSGGTPGFEVVVAVSALIIVSTLIRKRT
ncbi:MAG TPA: hypothetical protein ENI42_02770 [Thermoplasmatales archaeon]|nr:hypothetical protein [Thermoplasmatales archaeon]